MQVEEAVHRPNDASDHMRKRTLVSLAGPRAMRRVQNKGPAFQIAVHEAGHVVAARTFGIKVRSATIIAERQPDGSMTAGMVVLGDSEKTEAGRIMRDAEKAVLVTSWTLPDGAGWRSILRRVRALSAETDRLLDQWWPAIEALACRLLLKKVMDAEEISAVLIPFGLGYPNSMCD